MMQTETGSPTTSSVDNSGIALQIVNSDKLLYTMQFQNLASLNVSPYYYPNPNPVLSTYVPVEESGMHNRFAPVSITSSGTVTVKMSAGYVDFYTNTDIRTQFVFTANSKVTCQLRSFESSGSLNNELTSAYSCQLLINGVPVGSSFTGSYTYSSPTVQQIDSFGYRFNFSAFNKSVTSKGNTLIFASIGDTGIWTFGSSVGGDGITSGDVTIIVSEAVNDIIQSADKNTVTIVNKIDQSTTTVTNQIKNSTTQVTQTITDSTGKIIAAITPTPQQAQDASNLKGTMKDTTDRIKDNVSSIEEGTNRPNPEETAKEIDPLEKLDKTDQTYMTMKDGIQQILSHEFILTIMLMLFGFAFTAYVLFGKRT